MEYWVLNPLLQYSITPLFRRPDLLAKKTPALELRGVSYVGNDRTIQGDGHWRSVRSRECPEVRVNGWSDGGGSGSCFHAL